MKKGTSLFIITTLCIFVVLGIFTNQENKNQSSDEDLNCKFKEITPELVRSIGGKTDSAEDIEIIKQLNKNTPYCIDVCKKELENSRQNLDNEQMSEKDKEMCNKLGIVLPK